MAGDEQNMHVLIAAISGFCKDVPASFSRANSGTAGDQTRALGSSAQVKEYLPTSSSRFGSLCSNWSCFG